jgi:hypothetical protein
MKSKRLLWMLAGMMILLATVGFVLFSSTGPIAAKNPNAAQTAQSIMANITGGGDYSFTMTNTYRFNKATAADYFNNAWDGNAPTVKSQTSGGNFCTPAQPATPSAPDPDYTKLNSGTPGKNDVTGDNECAFLNGTNLTGDTYPLTKVLTTSCTSNGHTVTTTWTYTYTFNITPKNDGTHPNPPASYTAWDIVDQTGSLADVPISAVIAGESVVVSSQFPTGKYSFSLFDSSSSNRVQNLVLTITDANGNTVYDSSTEMDSTGTSLLYPDGIPSVLVYPVDFTYKGNAGVNGTAQAYLLEGYARGILNGTVSKTTPVNAIDKFPGNDNGGADGSALAEALMSEVNVQLGAGSYNITLTGVVKGNSADGASDTPIDVTSTINVVTPGCGTP